MDNFRVKTLIFHRNKSERFDWSVNVKRRGTEIVQVYVRKEGDTTGLLKTLKGFKRIDLATGTRSNAIIDLSFNSFEFYDGNIFKMDVVPGEYDLCTQQFRC